ncbi:hypothetical protein BD414DRAFT_506349 [Trametes punicea]|nr:hypothetical protein BD414DRAFT_506349 [Trametes punicea]
MKYLMDTIATLQESTAQQQLEVDETINKAYTTYTDALDEGNTYLDAAQSMIASLAHTHDDDMRKAQKELSTALKQSEALCASSLAPLALRFKVNGVVPEHIHNLICDLGGLGLKINQIKEAIMKTARAIGVAVKGDIMVKEGRIIAQMQIVEELQAANTLLGNPIDLRTFPLKLCRMMTDYTADQKKLFCLIEDWVKMVWCKVCKEKAVTAASLPEFLLALAEKMKAAVEAAGGETAWQQLSPEDLATRNISIQQAVVHHLQEAAYEAMPQHEHQLADLFVYGGCCMHNHLNAFKGRAARMTKYCTGASIQAVSQWRFEAC